MNRFSRLFVTALLPFSFALTVALSTPEISFAAPAKLFDPARITVKTLPNGVRSVVQESPGGDLVSIQVWVRAGSRFENKDNNGVTHLIETLALRASSTLPDNARGTGGARGVLESLGGTVSSLTARDSMFYSATVAAPFLTNALRALADATLAPDLADAKVEAVKEELMTRLAGADPTQTAANLAYTAAFQSHPYRRPPEGTLSGIAALTGNKVRLYHRARFAGENISVVIVGDVTPENGHKLVAQFFGTAAKATPQPPIPIEKPLTELVRQSQRGSLPITIVALGFRSPGIKNPIDVAASDVLLACWKEGRNATLRKVLNGAGPLNGSNDQSAPEGDEAAPLDDSEAESAEGAPAEPEAPAPDAPNEENAPMALAFDVDYLTQRDPGLFLIALIAPRDRNAAIGAVMGEVERVKNDGLTEEELARAKEILRLQYIRQSETISGQAGALGFYEMIDNCQFATTYLDRIAKVTNDDIRRVAKEYLKTDGRVEATIEGLRSNQQQPDNGTITARLFK